MHQNDSINNSIVDDPDENLSQYGEDVESQEHVQANIYVYDDSTGLLNVSKDGGVNGVLTPLSLPTSSAYVQDRNTGAFHPLQTNTKTSRYLVGVGGMNSMDHQSSLNNLGTKTEGFLYAIGLFACGIAGGLGIASAIVLYSRGHDSKPSKFEVIYAPYAMSLARLQCTLLSVSILSAFRWSSNIAKSSRWTIGLQSVILIVLSCAYGITVSLQAFEHQAQVAANEIYTVAGDSSLSQEITSFEDRLDVWWWMNLVRHIFCIIAWVLASSQLLAHTWDNQIHQENKH